MSKEQEAGRRQPAAGDATAPDPRHLAGVVLGLTTLIAVLVAAFAWPASNTEPRDVPLVVAGPAEVTDQLAARLSDQRPDAFDIRTASDRPAAVRLIEDREAYGAVVASSAQIEVLSASAASPAVSQLLGELAAGIGGEGGPPVSHTDLVPLPAEDPRGAGIAAGSLPIVLAGVVTGFALYFRVPTTRTRLVGLAGVAIGGGLVATATLQYWLGSLDGSYWGNSAVVALGIAAMAATLIGLGRLLGVAGLGLGGATMVALGNPLSGLTSAPELLPAGWGAFGQLLPPGAMGTALRSVAFFDGAGSGTAFLVLSCWLVVGLLLLCLSRRGRDGGPGPRLQEAAPAIA